jgi:carboxy-terminal domain RNA polymerase II polypeptide A small phosphatase
MSYKMAIKLIIFDIDGTLVDTAKEGTHNINVGYNIIMKTSSRPGIKELMEYCFNNYDVGFYTAASRDYATEILKLFLTDQQFQSIKFIKDNDNCSKLSLNMNDSGFSYDYFVYKPLHKIWKKSYARNNGWNKNNTLIIEDSPSTCIKNYGNAIYVPSYVYGRNDDVLFKLIDYVQELNLKGNVRGTEKRYWLK